MVFSSLIFLFIFLPACTIIYYVSNSRDVKNYILTGFSLIFYAWGEPIWVCLLVFSAFIDYLNGLFIEKYRGRQIAKLGVVSTLFFNLGILISFKYSDFIVENVNALVGTNFTEPGLLLPIGISFYTFQTISYTIDVYRGEVRAQASFMKFLLFVSLFHQLVAGPIVRYVDVANDIDNRVFNPETFRSGVSRFCKGLFKKVFVANIAGQLATQFLNGDQASMTVLGGWFGLAMFTLQIYFDFSGYSDMAIGLGRMFGFHYKENFNHPYIARSVTDFWRRWHMSLGSFFRDYVYIPLGGNRKHFTRNLFIVWGLTGVWHGASWNFIIWGLYFGVLLYLEKKVFNQVLAAVPRILQHVYALFFIMIGWAIFYFTDLNKLIEYLRTIFGMTNVDLLNYEVIGAFSANALWLTFAIVVCMPISRRTQELMFARLPQTTAKVIDSGVSIFFLFVSTCLLVGSTYNPFLYFRF